MKILILGINYLPELTGVGKYTGEMAEWLSNQGHDVRVITAPPYYPAWKVGDNYSQYRYKLERIKNIRVYRCPLYVPKNPGGIKRIIHLLSFAISSFPVALYHLFWKPAVVFVVEPPLFCSPSALLLAKLTGSKSILHVQDFEVDAAFDLGLLKNKWLRKLSFKIEGFLLTRFDQVSTISNKMLERLTTKGVAVDKQYFLPNWVDTSLIFPQTGENNYYRELGISLEQHVVLYSGNMGNKQGLEIIIDVAKKLSDKKNILFIMCGDGSAKSKLLKLSEGLENLMWIPFQPLEKLNEFFGLASIHLLPQSQEIADLVMPSKLTGMLASGKPIITTSTLDTQVASVVKNCGFVVPPDDVGKLSDAISCLVGNPELCKQFGNRARDYAVTRLDINNILLNLDNDLQNLVAVKN